MHFNINKESPKNLSGDIFSTKGLSTIPLSPVFLKTISIEYNLSIYRNYFLQTNLFLIRYNHLKFEYGLFYNTTWTIIN